MFGEVGECGHGGGVEIIHFGRVEGNTDAAGLGVHGEGALEEMVALLGDVLVQAGIGIGEDGVVLPQFGSGRGLEFLVAAAGRGAVLGGLEGVPLVNGR